MRIAAAAVAIWVAILAPVTVEGHQPTQGANHYSTPNTTETYSWSTSSGSVPPSWMTTPFKTTADTYWLASKNDAGPRWAYSATATSNIVRYVTRANTLSTVECPLNVTWDACAAYDSSGHFWFIEFAKDQVNSPWCQDPGIGFTTGCYDVIRASVHELGHQAGLARGSDGNAHSGEGEDWTVVQAGHAPRYPNYGWGTISPRPCDSFELQRRYDVSSSAGLYASCVDHLGSTVVSGGRLKTVLTQGAPSATIVCAGQVTTISGTGKLIGSTVLDKLSGNPLTSRSLSVQRQPSSGGTWTQVYTTTVTSSAAWSKVVGAPNGTWNFKVVYAGETTLAGSESPLKTITWSSTC